jgi:50S ribosomal subunit-associated GTPase HflX
MAVLNKLDLVEDAVDDQLREMSDLGVDAIATSAKCGDNVARAFSTLARQCLERGL